MYFSILCSSCMFLYCLVYVYVLYSVVYSNRQESRKSGDAPGRARREALHEVPTWHVFTSYTVTTSMCRLSKACLCVALFCSNVACPSSFLSCHRYLAVSHFTYVRYHYFVFAFLPSTLCFFLFPSVRVCIKLNVMGMFSSFAHRASLWFPIARCVATAGLYYFISSVRFFVVIFLL